MSGNNNSRDDTPTGGGGKGGGTGGSGAGGGGQPPDACSKIYHKVIINSPKAAVLSSVGVNDILQVLVDTSGTRPVLIAANQQGQEAGSLTFNGYLKVIECIQWHQVRYRAVVEKITGALYEVRVEPAE